MRILYGATLSPFVRKARLCLQEKGLEHELEVVMPFTPPEWYYDINPLGRIPGLRDGDVTLADSSVICQYLEEAYPQTARLFGHAPHEAARIRWLEKYADYEVAPLATFALFGQRLLRPLMGQPCDQQAVETALEQLPRHLDYLEHTLGDRAFLVGDALSMADLALASQLVNMGYADAPLDASRWPALDRHFTAICARPAMQAVLQSEQWIVKKMREKLAGLAVNPEAAAPPPP